MLGEGTSMTGERVSDGFEEDNSPRMATPAVDDGGNDCLIGVVCVGR